MDNQLVNTIKQIDDAVLEINISLNKLQVLKKITNDKVIKSALSDYILIMAGYNYQFMIYLMGFLLESGKKVDVDTEFNKIMKDFFKNGDK